MWSRHLVTDLLEFLLQTLGTDASQLLAQGLPAGLRQTDIGYEQFMWPLKTYLFGCSVTECSRYQLTWFSDLGRSFCWPGCPPMGDDHTTIASYSSRVSPGLHVVQALYTATDGRDPPQLSAYVRVHSLSIHLHETLHSNSFHKFIFGKPKRKLDYVIVFGKIVRLNKKTGSSI